MHILYIRDAQNSFFTNENILWYYKKSLTNFETWMFPGKHTGERKWNYLNLICRTYLSSMLPIKANNVDLALFMYVKHMRQYIPTDFVYNKNYNLFKNSIIYIQYLCMFCRIINVGQEDWPCPSSSHPASLSPVHPYPPDPN